MKRVWIPGPTFGHCYTKYFEPLQPRVPQFHYEPAFQCISPQNYFPAPTRETCMQGGPIWQFKSGSIVTSSVPKLPITDLLKVKKPIESCHQPHAYANWTTGFIKLFLGWPTMHNETQVIATNKQMRELVPKKSILHDIAQPRTEQLQFP